VVEGLGELILSSTYPSREYGDERYPWSKDRIGSIIDEYLSWANIWVHDVQQEYSTTEKIRRFIKPYFDEHDPLLIRSCGHKILLNPRRFKVFNCSRCDKCQRVIGSLVVCGVDPSICGFEVNEEIYGKIRNDIETTYWNPIYLKYHWEEVKKYIPDEITEDFNGSRRFLEWLREYEFD